MKITFKEKGDDKYFLNKNKEWIKTDEDNINSLWNHWVISEGAHRYCDEEGFLVFTYKQKQNE